MMKLKQTLACVNRYLHGGNRIDATMEALHLTQKSQFAAERGRAILATMRALETLVAVDRTTVTM